MLETEFSRATDPCGRIERGTSEVRSFGALTISPPPDAGRLLRSSIDQVLSIERTSKQESVVVFGGALESETLPPLGSIFWAKEGFSGWHSRSLRGSD
jgi:hypothetical protein